MTTFVKTEVRASEVSRGCDRMSVLRALGADLREPDDEQREWFQRGHLFEGYVGRQLAAKYGDADIVKQPAFEHPLGVGHSDFLIVSERLLIEVKSTQAGTLSTPVFENGVEQLRIAIHFHPDADHGALYMINPSTLRPAEVFRVVNSPEDDARIEETFTRIGQHIADTSLPDRVCAKPGQARGMFCAFGEVCFADWERPEPTEVDNHLALEAVSRLAALKDEARVHTAALKALDEGTKAAQAELEELLDEPESVVGPFLVKRTDVQRSPSFSMKAAGAAGFPVHTLDEFTRPGSSYTTWRVSRADEAGDIDYGDAPF